MSVMARPVPDPSAAWRKASKKSLKDELLLEYDRLKLLASSNAKDVAKGKKMITPASIFDKFTAAEDLAEPEDMEDLALGQIPEGEASLEDAAAQALAEEHGVEDEHAEEHAEEHASEMEAEEAESEVDEFSANLMSSMEKGHFELQVTDPKPRKAKSRAKPTIQVWLPLTFPPVPKKVSYPSLNIESAGANFLSG